MRDLLTGHADAAATALQATLAAHPDDSAAHLLLCRVFLSEDLASQAAAECATALATLPPDTSPAARSAAEVWAGRAFGAEASDAGPFAGMRLARRVKTAFAEAVRLDPTNEAATDALGEYLVAAPGIVGGSLPDALALADRILHTLPQSAHRLRALAAEKSHDLATAEREFQAAVAVANSPAALVDLGHFYARQHQPEKAAATLQLALAADRNHGPSSVDAASILLELGREPALATAALRAYLAPGNADAQTDAAPTFRAHLLLGRLLASAGDRAGARAQYTAALGVARAYAPAQKALAAL